MVTEKQIHNFLCVTHSAINKDAFAEEAGVSKELIKKVLLKVKREFDAGHAGLALLNLGVDSLSISFEEEPTKENSAPYGEMKKATRLKIYEAMLKYGYKPM